MTRLKMKNYNAMLTKRKKMKKKKEKAKMSASLSGKIDKNESYR